MSEPEVILTEPTPPPGEARGPGRPAGTTAEEMRRRAEEEAARAAGEAMLAQLPAIFAWPFDWAANRHGDYWRLSPKERQGLADAWRPIVERYALAWILQYGPWIIAGVQTGVILAPRVTRMMQDRKKAKEEAAEGKEPAPPDTEKPKKNPEEAKRRPGRPKKKGRK